MKFEEKLEAIKLRKSGLTYSVIRKRLAVSKSTLSLWLRDVKLTSEQRKEILVGLEKSRAVGAELKRADRQKRTALVEQQAKKEFTHLRKTPLFFVGLALYTAEGDKSQERVKFANSDPYLIKIMMRWFREICGVPESRFRIALHVHDLLCNKDAINYWVKVTGIPKSQFYKLYIKESSLRQRRNILYNGTCSVIISSKDLFRRIHKWKQLFFEHFEVL